MSFFSGVLFACSSSEEICDLFEMHQVWHLEGNLIKPVHEASHFSQPFLTRRQEVKTCQSIFPDKKNCLPSLTDKKNGLETRSSKNENSPKQALYVVQLKKMKNGLETSNSKNENSPKQALYVVQNKEYEKWSCNKKLQE